MQDQISDFHSLLVYSTTLSCYNLALCFDESINFLRDRYDLLSEECSLTKI